MRQRRVQSVYKPKSFPKGDRNEGTGPGDEADEAKQYEQVYKHLNSLEDQREALARTPLKMRHSAGSKHHRDPTTDQGSDVSDENENECGYAYIYI